MYIQKHGRRISIVLLCIYLIVIIGCNNHQNRKQIVSDAVTRLENMPPVKQMAYTDTVAIPANGNDTRAADTTHVNHPTEWWHEKRSAERQKLLDGYYTYNKNKKTSFTNTVSESVTSIVFRSSTDVINYLAGKTFYSSDKTTSIKINNYVTINYQESPFAIKDVRAIGDQLGEVIYVSSLFRGSKSIYIYPDKGCISIDNTEYCISGAISNASSGGYDLSNTTKTCTWCGKSFSGKAWTVSTGEPIQWKYSGCCSRKCAMESYKSQHR